MSGDGVVIGDTPGPLLLDPQEHLRFVALLPVRCVELFPSSTVHRDSSAAEEAKHEGGVMRQPHRRFTLAVLATALGAILLSFPSKSFAGPYQRWDRRHDRYDIRHDRRDLHRDWRDIHEDRGELRRDLRGHDWQDVRRDRQDLRQDWRDIHGDRRDLRADRRDLRYDLR